MESIGEAPHIAIRHSGEQDSRAEVEIHRGEACSLDPTRVAPVGRLPTPTSPCGCHGGPSSPQLQLSLVRASGTYLEQLYQRRLANNKLSLLMSRSAKRQDFDSLAYGIIIVGLGQYCTTSFYVLVSYL